MGGKYSGRKRKMSDRSPKRSEKKLPKSVRGMRDEAVKRGKKRRLMQMYSEY